MTGIGTFVPSPWSAAGRELAARTEPADVSVSETPVPRTPAPRTPEPRTPEPDERMVEPPGRPSPRAARPRGGTALRTGVAAFARRRRVLVAASLLLGLMRLGSTVGLSGGSLDVRALVDAVAVSVAALVVLAVAVPVVRYGRDRFTEFAPGEDVVDRLGLPAATVRPDEPTFALALLDIAGCVSEHDSLTVVQLSHPADCELGRDLAAASALVGRPRTLHELTPGSPPHRSGRNIDESAGRLYTYRTTELSLAAVTTLSATPRPCLLVVDTARSTWRDLTGAVERLNALGCAVQAVVVWTGRIPRDPSDSWDPGLVSVPHHS